MAQPSPTIVIDSREQKPWHFSLPTVRATVPSGADYSVLGFEASIGIERKSLCDLVGSLTQGRDRFERSLAALRLRPFRALVIEGSLSDVACGRYGSRAHPNAIVGSLAAIVADGVPVVFADEPGAAAQFAERLLLKFHSRALASQGLAA